MDGNLHIHLFGHIKTVVDGGGSGAPVLVQFESQGACANLLAQRLGLAGIAFSHKPEIHGESLGRLKHAVQVPGSGGAGSGVRPGSRAGAASDHGGDARHERLLDLLRADEMDMGVDTAGGDEHPFAGNDFGAGADNNRNPGLDIRLPALPIPAIRPPLSPMSALTIPQ